MRCGIIRSWQFIFVFTLGLLSPLAAQQISKNYVTIHREGSGIYYVFPQKGFRSEPAHNRLLLDITYINLADSATVNFSYFDTTGRIVDSLVFFRDTQRIRSTLKKIFVEPRQGEWEHRYSAIIPYSALCTFFSTAPGLRRLRLYTGEGEIDLRIKSGKWRKMSTRVSRHLLFNCGKS